GLRERVDQTEYEILRLADAERLGDDQALARVRPAPSFEPARDRDVVVGVARGAVEGEGRSSSGGALDGLVGTGDCRGRLVLERTVGRDVDGHRLGVLVRELARPADVVAVG